ncbi:MAG: J domain-containing protein [Enterovibrio sp.]
MALEQILVPRSAGSMSGEAVLAQFADFTPEAKKLFLLKLARATLTICQLITSELAQASQAVRTSSSSTETSPSATPEPFGPAEQTDSEDESPPQSTEVTPVIELATQQPSADAVTEAGLDEMNAAPTSPEEPDIATANSAPINRRSLSRSFSKLFRHKADDEAIKQALIKKLDDACRRNGVIQELERKRIEMSAFRYNPMSKKDFAKKLEDGKALLEQFNQNMHLLQDDNELFYRFLKVFALVLHTKLLDEMFAPSHREDVGLSLGFVSLPHYQTILSFLENAAPPWDFDVIYQKIKDFFNAVHIENIDENIPEQIIEIELFTLADVSLNPNAKLPNNYYLKALGLSPQATINEMRSAYKRLCLQYHPDKNSGDEAQATAMFLRLQIVATQLKIIL